MHACVRAQGHVEEDTVKGLSAELRSAERMLGRISEIKECGRRKRKKKGGGKTSRRGCRSGNSHKTEEAAIFYPQWRAVNSVSGLKKGE